jgi:UDP-N-acetylglucosamine 2-epimerase
MRIVGVIGAQSEPAAALLRALGERAETVVVAVEPAEGQGGAEPRPDHVLRLEPGGELRQTAGAIAALEPLLAELRPAAVLVCGEGNVAVAAALVAAKLEMHLIRLGAGVRSGERHDPGEVNRTVTDHVCDLLLCSDEGRLDNLRREGLGERAVLVGDVAADPEPAAEAVRTYTSPR